MAIEYLLTDMANSQYERFRELAEQHRRRAEFTFVVYFLPMLVVLYLTIRYSHYFLSVLVLLCCTTMFFVVLSNISAWMSGPRKFTFLFPPHLSVTKASIFCKEHFSGKWVRHETSAGYIFSFDRDNDLVAFKMFLETFE